MTDAAREPTRTGEGVWRSGRFEPADFAALASLELRARRVMEGFLHGLHGSPFHGLSVEFTDYRDYQPGDDLRHLDWRLYARSDRLCIKRYEHETNTRCLLAVDTSGSMAYRGSRAWGSKLEAARVLALALGWFLMRQNDAVGLLALGAGESEQRVGELCYLPPAHRPSQQGALLGRLRDLEPQSSQGLVELLDRCRHLTGRRGLMILLSDFLDGAEALTQPLERLRFAGYDLVAIQLLDPDEVDFPFAEGTLFEDLESGQRRQISQGAAERYRSRFESFLEAHRAQFRRLEIPHWTLRTDQDPAQVLGRSLAERARR